MHTLFSIKLNFKPNLDLQEKQMMISVPTNAREIKCVILVQYQCNILQVTIKHTAN